MDSDSESLYSLYPPSYTSHVPEDNEPSDDTPPAYPFPIILAPPASQHDSNTLSFSASNSSLATIRESPNSGATSSTATLPSSFKIGNKRTNHPFVNVEQVKGHLDLLGQFHELRERVRTGNHDGFPDWVKILEPDRRWNWFVVLAAERFERWCMKVMYTPLSQFVEESLPPLDVIMVWHAYLLNPGWYTEDTHRLPVLQNLSRLNELFSQCMAIISELVVVQPTLERLEKWFELTGTLFDPFESATVFGEREVVCPSCRRKNPVSLFNATGTGYVQRNFSTTCTCSFQITKDGVRAYKFARDFVKDYQRGTRTDALLAGTVYTSQRLQDNIIVGRNLKKTLLPLQAIAPRTGVDYSLREMEDNFLVYNHYSLKKIKQNVESYDEDIDHRKLKRIIKAYSSVNFFSLDLSGAVLRQGSFIMKMRDLGWIGPNRWDNPGGVTILQRTIARYHAFLDLTASEPNSFFVPTLDIDLAWHTHQLNSKRYASDCKTYVGYYIDHDDKVEENVLSNGFDQTSRAWQSRFKVPYAQCGCSLPGETIGQKLFSSRNPSQTHLVHSDHNGAAATHPSDHNSVYPLHHIGTNEGRREGRRTKAEKRRERDLRKVRGGKFDETVYARGEGHDLAFLTPVPLYWTDPRAACTAFYGAVTGELGEGGCVGHGGEGAAAGIASVPYS